MGTASMTAATHTQVLVSVELAQKIIDYLKMRPYHEVYPLIDGLLRAPRETTPKKQDQK